MFDKHPGVRQVSICSNEGKMFDKLFSGVRLVSKPFHCRKNV
jgi:hypothetical protein